MYIYIGPSSQMERGGFEKLENCSIKKKALISLLSTNPMTLLSASGFKILAKMIVLKTSCS